jgi:hypothetical protein
MLHKPITRAIDPKSLPGSTERAVGAAICTINRVDAPELPGMTVEGLKLAVAPAGRPEEDMVTTLSNAPPTGRTLTSIFTDPLCGTATDVSGVVTVNVDGVTTSLIVSRKTFEVEVLKVTFPE